MSHHGNNFRREKRESEKEISVVMEVSEKRGGKEGEEEEEKEWRTRKRVRAREGERERISSISTYIYLNILDKCIFINALHKYSCQ